MVRRVDEARASQWTNVLTILLIVVLTIVFWERAKGAVAFIVTLGILVFVHEMGHFLAAKAVGVRVHEFAIGMGPRLITVMRRGDTDYTLRILPLGGFVNLAGMQPDEADLPDGLAGKSAAARAFVFAAGPAMNLLLAIVILSLIGFVAGRPDPSKVMVAYVDPERPAARMGLQVGDQILRVRGEAVRSDRHLIELVQRGPVAETEMVIRRGSEIMTLRGTPAAEKDPKTGKQTLRFGFTPSPGVGPRLSLGASIQQGFKDFVATFGALGEIVRKRTFAQNVGGPVKIYEVTAQTSQIPFGREYALYQLHLLSGLSISLGVLNLLPIPILDGGHLFLLGIEVIRRRRLTPDAIRIAQMVGLAMLGVIFVLIMYNDLVPRG